MPKYQKVAFDPKTETYEIFDEYFECCVEREEVRRLVRSVKKHTPDWLEGL